MKIKSILLSLLLTFSQSAFSYEEDISKQIDNSENHKILIDVISYETSDINRHFEYAKEISLKYPEKSFRFGFHSEATYHSISNKNKEKYNLEKNDFSLIKDLKNVEFYLCKSGAKKRNVELEDVDKIFNTEYTSSTINRLSRKQGFLIIKEKNKDENEQ